MKPNRTLLLLSALLSAAMAWGMGRPAEPQPNAQPNILFIFSDDHALSTISAYGGLYKDVAPTPNIDSLAEEGAIFENSFCANSICGPSRACILTGKHSHKNGYTQNVGSKGFDQSQWTFIKEAKKAGYQTAIIGKWHLKTHPTGFDYWEILPGQGRYYNPEFIQMDGKKKQFKGYATDITTDKAIAWLDQRDPSKPFILMCQHKAPHRTFAPAPRYLGALDNVEIPEPDTLFDDYSNRTVALQKQQMEIDRHFRWSYDAKVRDEEVGQTKLPPAPRGGPVEYNRMDATQKAQWDAYYGPRNKAFLAQVDAGKMSHKEIVRWKYQRYVRNYLCTVMAVDESVGRLKQYLKDNGLDQNTIVIYSSDQGFYLGEHGWFDKRWMFEESFKMPFLIKWPGVIKPGSKPKAMIQNIDYAPTFLEMIGLQAPAEVQGISFVPVLKDSGTTLRDSLYYAYYETAEHSVAQHFGVRTERYKLFYLPDYDEWQLFDLKKDAQEMNNVYDDPSYAAVRKKMHAEYDRLREKYEAPDYVLSPKKKASKKKK